MGIRVLVVDDNPHVRWHGRVYPVNATFHRFLSAFLDLPGTPVGSIAHAVPLRDLPDGDPEPVTLPIDPRIRTVATAPFDGIAGYLRGAPGILRGNRPILAAAVREVDLVWIKVPGSNAALAAALAIRSKIPRFVWVAGSAREVARARFSGPSRFARILVGSAYDVVGRLTAIGGDRVVIGQRLADGDRFVTSLVEEHELRPPSPVRPSSAESVRLAWAGRLVAGKGLEELLQAVAIAPPAPAVQLAVLGDGPARADLERLATALGIASRVQWLGYVRSRRAYLDALGSADAFMFPSAAEGFPKVVLDAMAVGLPVFTTATGSLLEFAHAGLVVQLRPPNRNGLVAAIRRVADGDPAVAAVGQTASRFAAEHTRTAEAGRVIERWRRRWPGLGS